MNASAPSADMIDLAIVGAGPAGLQAAVTACELGLSAVLLDEGAAPGGQIYRAIETAQVRPPRWQALLGEDYVKGGELVRRFRASGADYRPDHAVFDISPDGGLGVLGPDGARWIEARRILIATGAMERPVPLPGWTLPGVMGAGAAQTLLKSSGLVPAGRTVIVGSGPLLFLVARQLLAAGAGLAAILDTTPRANYRRAAPFLPGALLAGSSELRKGIAWFMAIRRGPSLYRSGVSGVGIEGSEAVEAVTFTVAGRRDRLACDLVLVHEGVVPNVQLSMAAGAEHDFSEQQVCWRPRLDAFGRTSLERLLVAGDSAGIGGAERAADAGHLAALAAAADLGLLPAADLKARARSALARISRKLALRRFLDALYRPRDEVLAPPDDETLVCRCEEVTAGELRRVAAMGCPGPNQAKAFTRCGMGPCQGRMCGLAAAAVLARASGRSMAEVGHLRVRPPIKPITVGELAGLEGVGAPPAMGPLLPTAPKDGAGA
jgi:NADPH-dependent 2,4-dienoyl-CoA reductase/sulfur reductase-like enzyme